MASVEVLAGPERRRRWSVEQKQAIVAAAFGPGAVVRDVARRADVTASLIYRWRRDLQAAANGFAQVLVAPAGDGVSVPAVPGNRDRARGERPSANPGFGFARLGGCRRCGARAAMISVPSGGSGVAGGWPNRHAQGHEWAGAAGAAGVGV